MIVVVLVVGCRLSACVDWFSHVLFVARCLVSFFFFSYVVRCLLFVVDSWLWLFGPWFVVLVVGGSLVVIGSSFSATGSLLFVLVSLLF